MLTLAGGGTVTFDSSITCGVKVRVVGGTTVDFGGVSPAGLVLGDGTTAGKIKLTLDSTVAVNGDLVINNIGFNLSGSLVKDTDYAPFITCGDVRCRFEGKVGGCDAVGRYFADRNDRVRVDYRHRRHQAHDQVY